MVPLGINMAGYEARPGSEGNDGFSVGYFARIAPEKGLHVLADAYARFRRGTASHPARLEAAGYLGRVPEPYLNQIRLTLEKAGLAGEFVYRGALDRAGKLAFLRTLDVLSVPATYDEPKGMFLLEAMAAGVPVVQPRRGAFVEIVERTGGGLLVNPDDPASLAEGLQTLWQDRATARSLGQRAFHGVRAHYSVAKSADVLLDVYNALLKRGATSHADSAVSVA
jgi:glycosyltransferase involved in cell wall biosynthesis